MKPIVAVLVVVVTLFVLAAGSPRSVGAQSTRDVTAETVAQWMTELSNWGRWGEDDQLGTLNLITADKRRQAGGLVTAGTSVSLSHTYLTERSDDATSPFGHDAWP